MNAVEAVLAFNHGREPERVQMKFAKMAADPFVFLRGACHLFYDRLPVAKLLQKAPLAWSCGDLHLENFGSYKGDNRLTYFDINDFDEAALAPCTLDVLRLLTSVLVAADGLQLREAEAMALCQCIVASYAETLAGGKARWIERQTADGLVRELLDGVAGRSRAEFLDTRTHRVGRQRKLTLDNGKALAATREQKARVRAVIEAHAATQPEPKFFRILDIARRVAGTGSLGVERHVVLVHGRGSPDGNFLLDLKEALPSTLATHLRKAVTQPKWPNQAERIVALQRREQAVSMAFLQAISAHGRSYVLRALQPSEDRVSFKDCNKHLRRLDGVGISLGQLTAWSHLRGSGRQGSAIADELIAFGNKRKWRSTLLELAVECRNRNNADWREFSGYWQDVARP